MAEAGATVTSTRRVKSKSFNSEAIEWMSRADVFFGEKENLRVESRQLLPGESGHFYRYFAHPLRP